MKRALLALLAVTSGHAFADDELPPAPVPEPTTPPEPAPPPEPTQPAAAAAPTPAELAARIEALEERGEKIEVLEQNVGLLHEQLERLAPLRSFITVFLDVGWFAAGGNGAGVRPDIGHRYVHDYNGVPAEWVLIGDPLSTTVNSLGEPADLGASRSITDDTIDSNGTPTFIVNTVGLAIGRSVGHGLAVKGLVEFLPRPGPDTINVENARIEYKPTTRKKLFLTAGKVESVLGIEYREQDAPARTEITPSLLCRYTCGRPLGVRAALEHGRFDLSALVASGNTFQERFERDPRLASANAPTIAGHAMYLLPIANGIKVGVSGSFGPQDGQSALHVHQWHYGLDLRVHEIERFSFQAEFVQGKQQGSSTSLAQALDAMPSSAIVAPRCSEASCLRYKAAYGLVTFRPRRWVTPYARVDWRDARHQQGVDFLYVSRVLRGTAGLRFSLTSKILAKVEYTHNVELLGPQFPNDVLTTSVVISTE